PHRHLAAAIDEHAQDVALHAVVVGRHVILGLGELPVALTQFPAALGPFVGFVGGNDLGEVHAGEAGKFARLGQRLVHIDAAGHDAAGLRALLAQDARQFAGVDVGDADYTAGTQIVGQRLLGTPVGDHERQVADDQTGGVDLRRFLVLFVDAGVTDVRVRQGDDVPTVGGIGEDFLIAGDRGVEHHLADRHAFRTNGLPPEHRPVCESEDGGT